MGIDKISVTLYQISRPDKKLDSMLLIVLFLELLINLGYL